MITNQTIIRCFSFFSQFQPSLALLQNLFSFEVKMTANDCLKAFWRVADIFQHGKFDISITDYIGICFIFFLALKSALFLLKARLIEVDVFAHDDGLDADQYLQESGNFRVPVFHG